MTKNTNDINTRPSRTPRIIISAGGTGGHIFPALAVADEIKNRYPETEILFVGAKDRMEMQKVPAAGYKIIGLNIAGLQRKLTFKNFLLPFKIIGSLSKARRIIKKFKPDIAVGFGGYASGPVLYSAARMKIPTVIQEQNSYAGLTNRKLAARATAVCTAYEGMDKFFPKEKINLTGNPVRKGISTSSALKEEALSHFNLSKNKKTILVIGGSLGARTINESIASGLDKIIEKGYQLIWQTGQHFIEKAEVLTADYEEKGIKALKFIERMDYAYAAADVIISRAGALSVSELCIVGKPVILVPSPNVAEDHQTKNAEALVQSGAALLIKDSEAREKLIDAVLKLSENKNAQETLSQNIRELAKPDATQKITDIIMSLAMPKKSSDKKQPENIYFVGIGGIGMSALARYFNSKGKKVAGYDLTPSPITDRLIAEGINIHFEDDPNQIPGNFKNQTETLVIYTPAVPKNHTELCYFQQNGFYVKKRAEVLGLISQDCFTVAVAGTHGKTTVTSLITHILTRAGKNSTAFVGGVMKNYDSNFLRSTNPGDEIMIVEADEYDRSFLQLKPNIAVVTSVEPDHLDIYGDKENLISSFRQFMALLPADGKLIVKNEIDLPEKDPKKSITRYGLEEGDVCVANLQHNPEGSKFKIINKGQPIGEFQLGIGGQHNVENALAAVSVALQLGIDNQKIKEALASWKGIKRRFEYIIKQKGLVYIDDYAHHPTEIRTLIQSVRKIYIDLKITVVFQPHLYSRTRDFADEFAESLSLADRLILLDIYPAREKPIAGINSDLIIEKVKLEEKIRCKKEELLEVLNDFDQGVLLTVGAGDIDRFVEPIKKTITKKNSR